MLPLCIVNVRNNINFLNKVYPCKYYNNSFTEAKNKARVFHQFDNKTILFYEGNLFVKFGSALEN